MNEATLQEHVVTLLRSFGRPEVCWFCVPNGESRSKSVGARLKRQGVTAGAPDLVFCIGGRFVGVELKIDKGKLSEKQSAFAKWIHEAGGLYFVVHGMTEAFELMEKLNVLRPNVKIGKPK